MTSFLIIILIIAQLISFYLIILLNTKIAKFKELEIKQDKLIREMDDAISAYLIEMREENDRLIQELSNVQKPVINHPVKIEEKLVKMDEEEKSSTTSLPISDFAFQPKKVLPKSIVKKAYEQQHSSIESTPSENQSTSNKKDISTLSTFEQRVIQLHDEGNTIEQIAKITQKGKTEIELLLKFHS